MADDASSKWHLCPSMETIIFNGLPLGLFTDCKTSMIQSLYLIFFLMLSSIQILAQRQKVFQWIRKERTLSLSCRYKILASIIISIQDVTTIYYCLSKGWYQDGVSLSNAYISFGAYVVSTIVLVVSNGQSILLHLLWTGNFMEVNYLVLGHVTHNGNNFWAPWLVYSNVLYMILRYVLVGSLFGIGVTSNGLLCLIPRILKAVSCRGSNCQSAKASKISDEEDDATSYASKFFLIWPYVWTKGTYGIKIRVILCTILLLCGRVINLYIPLMSKDIINRLSSVPAIFPWELILCRSILSILQKNDGGTGLVTCIRQFLWMPIRQFAAKGIMVDLFRHLHSLSLSWHLNRKTGEIIGVIERSVLSINSLLDYIAFNIFPTLLDIIVAIVYFVIQFDALLGMIILIAVVLYLVVMMLVSEWRTKYRRATNRASNRMKQMAIDSLLNFETVKYYGNEDVEVDLYRQKFEDFQAIAWITMATLKMLETAQNFVVNMCILLGSLFCAYLVAWKHEMTVGDYVLFTSYIVQLFSPLKSFGNYYRLIQQALIDMESVINLMEVKEEVRDVPNCKDLKLTKGLIEFDNVHFSYKDSHPVLRGISFTVLPGQFVAIVGPSGSGKSTIIRLLFRFYDINSGCIRLDGQDIKRVSQKSLRKNIAVVPQDTVLFKQNIKYNIKYGRITSTDTELEAAARAADIHDRILSFPEGYDTDVGERGLKLSGGEKQRISIARSILKAPLIMLLDEATSALDTTTERNIQTSLSEVCKDITTIAVAHRLSTIINADQILVVKDGVIAEKGRHEDLLAAGGLYHEMWMQQLKAQEDALSSDLSVW